MKNQAVKRKVVHLLAAVLTHVLGLAGYTVNLIGDNALFSWFISQDDYHTATGRKTIRFMMTSFFFLIKASSSRASFILRYTISDILLL